MFDFGVLRDHFLLIFLICNVPSLLLVAECARQFLYVSNSEMVLANVP